MQLKSGCGGRVGRVSQNAPTPEIPTTTTPSSSMEMRRYCQIELSALCHLAYVFANDKITPDDLSLMVRSGVSICILRDKTGEQ